MDICVIHMRYTYLGDGNGGSNLLNKFFLSVLRVKSFTGENIFFEDN